MIHTPVTLFTLCCKELAKTSNKLAVGLSGTRGGGVGLRFGVDSCRLRIASVCHSHALAPSLPPLLASRCIAPCAGHVLISPRRVVKRFSELSQEEVCDLWQLAQRVGSAIEPHYKASSLTMAIQVLHPWGRSPLAYGGLPAYPLIPSLRQGII